MVCPMAGAAVLVSAADGLCGKETNRTSTTKIKPSTHRKLGAFSRSKLCHATVGMHLCCGKHLCFKHAAMEQTLVHLRLQSCLNSGTILILVGSHSQQP
jgi:hypothetical protein